MTTHGNGDAAAALKACPFCGAALAKSKEYDSEYDCQVFCESCGCHGPLGAGTKMADELWNNRAPAPQTASEEVVERVKRAIIDAHDADTCWTYDDLARAAVAETRSGDDAEVAHAVAQMAAHDRDEALVRAMEAEKQLSDLTALLSQVRSELDAMTNDRDQARRQLAERDDARHQRILALCDEIKAQHDRAERAEEVRDAVCEERNMLAKRIGELEAALGIVALWMSYLPFRFDAYGHPDLGLKVEDVVVKALGSPLPTEEAGKRGGGTIDTAEGEARIAASGEVVKRAQDEEGAQ